MGSELLKSVIELEAEMRSWMRELHRNAELSMEEVFAPKFIASKLRTWGYKVSERVGGNGVVASMSKGVGEKSIGLRADFDALPIQEDNNLPYRSKNDGKAHLCGHDGHSTMLLGAAKYIAKHIEFNGTLRLIFQPGEETMEGGRAMVDDGLFERFPVDAIYGMHNMPGVPLGTFLFCKGKMMSAVDNWSIILTGKGAHGSMPEQGIDPITCGASIVMALQTIVSRNVSPWDNCVVNVGSFQAGNAGNAIPQSAILKLSIRNMDEEVRKFVLNKIRKIAKSHGDSFGCKVKISEGVPGLVLVNSDENTEWASRVAKKTFGAENVVDNAHPLMSSEDFAFMLNEKNGCYCMIGNGASYGLHHPKYEFNQKILPYGATYWVSLVEEYLK